MSLIGEIINCFGRACGSGDERSKTLRLGRSVPWRLGFESHRYQFRFQAYQICTAYIPNLQRLQVQFPSSSTKSRVAQRKRAGPITQRSMDRNHPLLSLLPRRVFSIEAHTYHNINLLSCAFPDLARFIPLNVELVFTEMWPRMPPLPTTTKILKS